MSQTELKDTQAGHDNVIVQFPLDIYSYIVGNDSPSEAFTSRNKAFDAMCVELLKRDEEYDHDDWNYWRSKLDHHDKQVLSMILENGADENGKVSRVQMELFVDHYNKNAQGGNRFSVIHTVLVN